MSKAINYTDFDESHVITKAVIPKDYHGKTDIVLDNAMGDMQSPVVCIEYIDLQCPFCRLLAPAMGDIVKQFKDRVAFAIRYFPLPQHANAVSAAIAVEAAARQSKFMAMSRAVFAGQLEWQDLDEPGLVRTFEQYARQAKLADITRWLDDYENASINGILAKINFQTNLGIISGVSGTPTVEINGYQLDDPSGPAIVEALETRLVRA